MKPLMSAKSTITLFNGTLGSSTPSSLTRFGAVLPNLSGHRGPVFASLLSPLSLEQVRLPPSEGGGRKDLRRSRESSHVLRRPLFFFLRSPSPPPTPTPPPPFEVVLQEREKNERTPGRTKARLSSATPATYLTEGWRDGCSRELKGFREDLQHRFSQP